MLFESHDIPKGWHISPIMHNAKTQQDFQTWADEAITGAWGIFRQYDPDFPELLGAAAYRSMIAFELESDLVLYQLTWTSTGPDSRRYFTITLSVNKDTY